MLTPDKPLNDAKLFDERALVAELALLANEHAGSEQELRRVVSRPCWRPVANKPSNCS